MKITIKTSELEMSLEYPTTESDIVYYPSRTENLVRTVTNLITECSEKTIEIIKAKNHEK